MEDIQCPWNGCKQEFDSDMGVKVHHSRAHGESIAGVLVVCDGPNCDEKFRKEENLVEKYDHHFHTEECYGVWKSENHTDENAPRWKGKEMLTCEWCGDEFLVYPSRVDERRFCGNECRGEWQSVGRVSEDAPNWRGGDVVYECDYCGDIETTTQSTFNQTELNFCHDKNCHGKWLSENNSGPNNPTWKGGEFPYGKGFNDKKKELIRSQQDYECYMCSIHQDELDRALDVHHLQKARRVDDPEVRNHPDNLVAVCRSCHHRKMEPMAPLLPQ